MPKKTNALTVQRLAKMLADAFEEGGWGDIDPDLFRSAAESHICDDDCPEDHARDIGGICRVLSRVVETLREQR